MLSDRIYIMCARVRVCAFLHMRHRVFTQNQFNSIISCLRTVITQVHSQQMIIRSCGCETITEVGCVKGPQVATHYISKQTVGTPVCCNILCGAFVNKTQ